MMNHQKATRLLDKNSHPELDTSEILEGDKAAKYLTMVVTEFRQPLQVQSHLEMPRILVQLGHTQCT